MRLIQSLYENARGRVRVGCYLDEKFSVKVGFHQEFWKPSAKSFVQDVPGKTCMQMTWSSYLNRWRNYKRS